MQLQLTERIRIACKEALQNPRFCKDHEIEARKAMEATQEADVGVSLPLLREVCRCLDNVWFHELIKDTAVFIEPEKAKEMDPRFEAYLAELRAQQHDQEYARMISSVVVSEDQRNAFRIRPDDIKEIKSHVAAIFNILFSMVAVYLAVYMATRTMLEDLGLRVLLSLAGAVVIGAVETLLYAKYAHVLLPKPKKDTRRIKEQ